MSLSDFLPNGSAQPTYPTRANAEFGDRYDGSLPAGTVTARGTVVRASLTAYEMTDGAWVPFGHVHGRDTATPLVRFAS